MPLADRYRWLFRRSPTLLVALDKDGFHQDASDLWVDRFGYSREELARLKPHNIATPESALLIEKEYRPVALPSRSGNHTQRSPGARTFPAI